VTLGQRSTSYSMDSLQGGGAHGGVVQPSDTNRTVTLSLGGLGFPTNFGGTLRDNGNGKLAVSIQAIDFTEIQLTGANTYSGATTVKSGDLILSGNGSALNSVFSVTGLAHPDSLTLSNATIANTNRLSDSFPVTLDQAPLQLTGNSSIPVNEVIGTLDITGLATIRVSKPGGAATQLTSSGLTRNGHATVSIVGEGVAIGGLANDATGIVSPMITAGNDWATIGNDGRITAFTSYTNDLNSGSTTDHVKLTASGTTTLAAATTRGSLYLQKPASGSQTLDLAGQSLALTSGGIFVTSTSTIRNGDLVTSAPELDIYAKGPLNISASIRELTGGTALVKSGPEILTLTGANTYSGNTAIMQGLVVVSSDANLGTGPAVEFNSSTLRAAGSFSSSKGLVGRFATIDTAGFDVAFSGPHAISISKKGAGALTLAAGASGSISLQAGKLQTSGTIDGMSILAAASAPAPAVLDIGGLAPATITTQSFSMLSGKLEIDFGLGNVAQDLISITSLSSTFSLSSEVRFEFTDLGGVTTGIDYPLITYQSALGIPNKVFGLGAKTLAAGWIGTFTINPDNLSVRFTAVPEPRTWTLMLPAAAAGLLYVVCRKVGAGSKLNR
jgi:fibronectin-binding autotransporter adhesin